MDYLIDLAYLVFFNAYIDIDIELRYKIVIKSVVKILAVKPSM